MRRLVWSGGRCDEDRREDDDDDEHVGVNQASTPQVKGDAELRLGNDVQLHDPDRVVLADSVRIDRGAPVYDVVTNELTNRGNILGDLIEGVALPYQPLPAVPGDITPGPVSVVVPAASTRRLDAGAYGALDVGEGAVLTLSGGVYHFDHWTVADEARIVAEAPTEIRVAGRVELGAGARLGRTPSPGAIADDLVLYVLGPNGDKGRLQDSPAAARFGPNSAVVAYVVAPNGTVQLASGTSAAGSVLARWVDIGSGVVLNSRAIPARAQ